MTTPDIAADAGSEKKDRFANRNLIWATILELRNSDRRINRRALAELTGLKPGIVDDHVERWIEKDQLRRAGMGELEVIEQFPASRPVSVTGLRSGLVKLEIGSDLLELTPTEARDVARWFAGFLHELAQTDSANKAVVLCHELAKELKEARREIKALRVHAGVDDAQTKQMALLE
ncbi:hypothetical protein AcdelDRAFT_0871 [Acidovorax delafieldii 2AN]|uniref:Uncharacterized protein n=1 Tax=Acidovorax delafieldii 2AN TaxID=573060 RepID=C5T1U1_ACIDE|nr:hypothetical protein [Acidovorax delafieldii]EER61536.1 hypothetical protein AcdelDRAFT_0871 [Acidovorax delafieldii 2AN]